MIRKKTKIAVGMSGGVDSSVAALLLKEQGFDVVGLFMKLWHDPCGTAENACCDEKARADAEAVAEKIGIPFYVVDARIEFKKEVTDYFIDEYNNCRTPNPCVVCNEKIKFGWMLDFAEKIGCSYLATGHYARIKRVVIPAEAGIQESLNGSPGTTLKNTAGPEDDRTRYSLLRGVDTTKDQSYFLYRLNQKQLSKIVFPLGEMTKTEVRKLAKEYDLPVYEKKESQEICFVEDDYRSFLRRNLGADSFKPGRIIDSAGTVLGKHEGLINYTIGQRRKVNQESRIRNHGEDRQPLYVIGLDSTKNELIVGEDKELFRQEFEIRDASFVCHSRPRAQSRAGSGGNPGETGNATSWIPDQVWDDIKGNKQLKIDNLKVKVRYRSEAIACSISAIQDSSHFAKATRDKEFLIRLERPVRAITPGQSAVLYLDDEIIGGGTIEE